MTKTEIWSAIFSYYDNLPLPDSGLMTVNTDGSRPGSFELSLRENGDWDLNNYVDGAKKVLTSGHISIAPQSWHNLKLRFKGSNIQARVDGKVAGEAHDSSHLNGMAGSALGGGIPSLTISWCNRWSEPILNNPASSPPIQKR